MYIANGWKDYEVIATGGGEKLERWGRVILRRPDPQTIWPAQSPEKWERCDARYHRSAKGGGEWEFMKRLPEKWEIHYRDLKFWVRPTGFKHTGLFPEQAVNWDWMSGLIQDSRRPIRVLNLFGYTGGATLACAVAGAHVTHVDAAKGMVQWAGENRALSGIDETRVRWIVDDALKFVMREQRRGNSYEGILMDPPSYGRGPTGQVWKIEDDLYALVEMTLKLLSDDPCFVLMSSYSTGLSPSVMGYVLASCNPRGRAEIECEELGLPVASTGYMLPCGASARMIW